MQHVHVRAQEARARGEPGFCQAADERTGALPLAHLEVLNFSLAGTAHEAPAEQHQRDGNERDRQANADAGDPQPSLRLLRAEPSRPDARLGRGDGTLRTAPFASAHPPPAALSSQLCNRMAAAALSIRPRCCLAFKPGARRRPAASLVDSHSSYSSTLAGVASSSFLAKARTRLAAGPSRPFSSRGRPRTNSSISSVCCSSFSLRSKASWFFPSKNGRGWASRPRSSATARPTRTAPRSIAAARTGTF